MVYYLEQVVGNISFRGNQLMKARISLPPFSKTTLYDCIKYLISIIQSMKDAYVCAIPFYSPFHHILTKNQSMPLKKISVFVPPHETPFVLTRLVGDILNVFTGEHINHFSNV